MIYFIKPDKVNVVKIGQSDNPDRRLIDLQTACFKRLILLKVIKITDEPCEGVIHEYLATYKTESNNEWYKLTKEINTFIEKLETSKLYCREELKNILINSKVERPESKKYQKPQGKFNKLIKKNREKLIVNGFKDSVLKSWMYGNRVPSFDNAVKLAAILNLLLSEIPYRQIVINRP